MAHKHSVYDTDTHFIINGLTRTVKNADFTKTMLVQYDHNSERVTFEIPRMIDGHDMSTCNIVQVHYINIDASNKSRQQKDVYDVDDLQISPDGEDVVICSWLISGNATKYVGPLYFCVRFVCSTDGNTDYAWNTAVHSGVYVSEGIYNGESLSKEYADILTQFEDRIAVLEQGGGSGGAGAGEDGGYYSPAVSQTSENTMRVEFTPSKDGMEEVSAQDITLPAGQDGSPGYTPIKGTDYWTDEDKAEIVTDVLAALPDGDEVAYG